MALRILWDDKETAILVDYYIKFREGKLTRKQAIEDASIELRNRAVQGGMEIDNIFRNENGIAMQMSKIEDLFFERKGRLSKAPQVFIDIVNKYITNRKAFDEILREARGVRKDSISVQEQYFSWLSDKVSPAQMSELYLVYQDIESFCLSRKILKEDLFKTVDVSTIAAVKTVCIQTRFFAVHIRKK